MAFGSQPRAARARLFEPASNRVSVRSWAGSGFARVRVRTCPGSRPVRDPRLGRFAIPGSGCSSSRFTRFAVRARFAPSAHPVRVRFAFQAGPVRDSQFRGARVRGSPGSRFAPGSRTQPTRFGMAQPAVARPQQNKKSRPGPARPGPARPVPFPVRRSRFGFAGCPVRVRFGFAVGLVRGWPGSRPGSRFAHYGSGFAVRGSRNPGSGSREFGVAVCPVR